MTSYSFVTIVALRESEGRGVEWKEWPEIRSGGETETITERKWEGSKRVGTFYRLILSTTSRESASPIHPLDSQAGAGEKWPGQEERLGELYSVVEWRLTLIG